MSTRVPSSERNRPCLDQFVTHRFGMASSLSHYRAECLAYLARTGLDRRLQVRHMLLVGISMLTFLAWLIVQTQTPLIEPMPVVRQLALSLGVFYICGSLLLSIRAQERAFRHLRVVTDSAEERAALLTRHIERRDRFLLLIALAGQSVAWVDVLLGIRLWSADILVVALPLLPTVQQIWIGFDEVPTRGRVVFLYKLVALYSERARARQDHATA